MTLSSCNSVQIRDIEVCSDLGARGATCEHTLSDSPRDIPLAAWNIERIGRLSVTAKDFAEIKSVIQKLCHKTKACTIEAKKTLEKMDKLEGKSTN